jgi:signal peptidase I
MQPTLNGIIAYGFDETPEGQAAWDKVKPNPAMKVWDLFWRGRNYIDLVAKEDFIITGGYQKNPFKFFSFTYLERTKPDGSKMKPLRVWAPMDKLLASQNDPGLGLSRTLARTRSGIDMIGGGKPNSPPRFRVAGGAAKIEAGTVLARGYIDTGDQVLVNKFSYHFRPPNRGEVFVFTTQDIELIMQRSKQSQHYIKRLSAVPGDTYEVKHSGELFINGARATAPGSIKVMSKENGFNGFTVFGGDKRNNQGKLNPKEYLALGDNSAHSWDSRGWGPVPEKNLVGPALFVYWPFGAHWGLIR